MGGLVAVAYSGGRDSTALLHATLLEAKGSGLRVVALHVHHALNPQADQWLAQCRDQCAAWADEGLPVTFAFHRVSRRPAKGDSVEAWARTERYAALAALAKRAGAELVLLAHHQRDQAETFLLQALRGAGVAGLSGMPREVRRAGVRWLRPWLAHSRAEIDAYIKLHQLNHVDDDSNEDCRFARNRLRLGAWPALVADFPHAESKLADAARWAQVADACLREVAQADLALIAPDPERFDIKAWAALSPARRGNALREWLLCRLGLPAPASLSLRLLAELDANDPARWHAAAGFLCRYRGYLTYTPQVASVANASGSAESSLVVTGIGEYPLPGWGGVLTAVEARQGGVCPELPLSLSLVPRHAGARFQAGVGRPPRSLKKQYQQMAVPSWGREGPLIYRRHELVFVPGLGMDARIWAEAGRVQLVLQWHAR